MNEIIKGLVNWIYKFEKYALLTDSLFIDQYGIKEKPLIAASNRTIPRMGELAYGDGLVQYRFHGNGCEFIFDNDIVVDFNYSAPDWQYEGLSPFKFWKFISRVYPQIENKDMLEKHLIELEQKGVIYKVKPPYQVYRLAQEEEE